MRLDSLFQLMCAAHLSALVESPLKSRGGIMLVSMGGNFKSSVLEVLEYYHPQALIQTDMTVQTLQSIRDQISNELVYTLAFSDFQKLYERNPATATNIEGALRALTDEGFSQLAFEDQRVARSKTRALVIGAMTPSFESKRFPAWSESGFTRRFLWLHYKMADPRAIIEAVVTMKPVDFGAGIIPVPRSHRIPFDCTDEESRQMLEWVRFQYDDHKVRLVLLQRVISVLKWWARECGAKKPAAKAMEVLADISSALTKEGAYLQV